MAICAATLTCFMNLVIFEGQLLFADFDWHEEIQTDKNAQHEPGKTSVPFCV